jgi:hypothetical protein
MNGAEKPLIGFGISEENVKRLKKGMPILINLKEMGIEADILIFYGETEAEMTEAIKPYIGTETVIKKSDKHESN